MAINVKNERVIELARRAAELTGGTQTAAIEQALSRLVADHETRAQGSRAELVWRTLGDIDVRLNPGQGEAMQTVMDGLYDESGLPA